jgi:hypothetical protein
MVRKDIPSCVIWPKEDGDRVVRHNTVPILSEGGGEEEQQRQKVVSDTGHKAMIGELLGHLGFVNGAMVDTPGISHEEMALAWSTEVVTEDDRAAILVLYHVDIISILARQSQTKTLLTRVRSIVTYVGSILKTVGLQLQTRRP